MKATVALAVVLICLLAVCTSVCVESQQPRAGTQVPTIRVQSSLVLVDVITRDLKSGLPVRDFKRKDFRVFDNRHEVRMSVFDVGVLHDTRPITLWLVVICNENGLPEFGASAEFLGRESLFQPALDNLQSHDRVGIVRPSSIYFPPKIVMLRFASWPKRSSRFLSKAVPLPETRQENRLSEN